jgi:tight adherence protein C
VNFDILIPILTFSTVMCLGGAAVLNAAYKRKTIQERLVYVLPEFSARHAPETPPLVLRLMARMGTGAFSDASPQLRAQMARAGFYGRGATALFFGSKVLLLVAGLGAGAIAVSTTDLETVAKVAVTVMAGCAAFFIPNIYVGMVARKRTTAINDHLPDMVDLLEVCVSGGMGLDTAWNAATDEIRSVCPVLGDEMALTNLEIHLGEDRGSAIRHMAQRTGVSELLSLVAVLVQSERFGTTISEALRVFAASMRETRSQRAEEHAEQMAVKMLFPMIILIFPVVLIVAVGPAVIALMKLFSN